MQNNINRKSTNTKNKMNKSEKKFNIFSKLNIKQVNKASKKTAIVISVVLLIAVILAIAIPVTITQKKKAEALEPFSWKVKAQWYESAKYQILVTVYSPDGIEYVKTPDPDGYTISGQNKTTLSFDYEILNEQTYEFKVKEVGKPERTETIKKETEYKLVNGVYSNEPNLVGYKSKYTRYMVLNGDDITPGNWISSPNPVGDKDYSSWYDYQNGKWANIFVETMGKDTYFVWIPRYCYKVDSTSASSSNQRMDVKFIDTANNYKDANGNVTTWEELQSQGYQIPDAFTFDNNRTTGYWESKYTVGNGAKQTTINYQMVMNRGVMTLKNIKLNSDITSDTNNPITKYTIALNGKIEQTIENSADVADISNKEIKLTNTAEGENVINITGLNSANEVVGSNTKEYVPAKVNEPDLSGFDKNTTFYVTYDANENEHSTIPISQDAPDDLYEYGERRWANIVTRNNGLETYFTWIPRYEYLLDDSSSPESANVRFLEGTSTEADKGYQIPEAFTFNGKQITGYWQTKYTVGSEQKPAFDTEVMSTDSSIKTKGVTGTGIEEGQTYKYYIIEEGQNYTGTSKYKGMKTTTNSSDYVEFSGLDANKEYTILVEIRKGQDEYVGTVAKQIKTIDANKPDLSGFSEDNTYYVLYDNDGNETIGDKIKKDGSNMPSNWYNYKDSKWANIVVKANGLTTYFTWIPRYEYKITSSEQQQKDIARTEVRFLSGTSTETDTAYQIPDAFTFNGQQLTGYWESKYTVGN